MTPVTSLNEQQQQAVEATKGPLLILAGAGSGKTRVLTYRIAQLIESGAAFPGEIFAVTFTNKAAREMRERVARLLGGLGLTEDSIWITTFHSAGAKILRTHGHRIGLQPGFTIYDDSDQLSLIKNCMERLGLNDKVIAPKAIMYRINQLKNDAIDPREFRPTNPNFFESKAAPVMRAYEEAMLFNNAVDFGDLLFKTYLLFLTDTELRDRYQDNFPFIMVDEYQDTNPVQYKLLRLLTEKYRNLCVVGDEDQSIYKWRGADIRNIMDFEKDFPEAKVIKLEENYRSTAHIIRAASHVISHNKQRKEKTLFTSNPDGEQVQVHFLDSDLDEARWVVRSIKERVAAGAALSEIAIFYRTHAQSRLLEDILRYERLAYKIFGGLKFYDRAEVKDAIAYLRVFVNPRDEVSLYRIINVPARGIGKTTLEVVRDFAAREKMTALEAIGVLASGREESTVNLNSGARKKLGTFLSLFNEIQKKINEYSPQEFYAFLLAEIGYLRALEIENTVESAARLENLKELQSAISEYESRTQEPTLAGFLEEVALVTDADKVDDSEFFVTLMTLHSAKGLEYPIVYLVGLEEGLFPSIRGEDSASDSENIEEERRLCYVGMTRARERLFMTSARMRRVYGVTQVRQPSRFLDELPVGEVSIVDHGPRVENRAWRAYDGNHEDFGFEGRTSSANAFDEYFGDPDDGTNDKYPVGQRVKHPDYGSGLVVKREGQRESLKVAVKFDLAGIKKFVVKFAPLTPIE